MTLGTRIREARQARKMSRPELSRRSGVKYPTLAGIENDDQTSSTLLPDIAQALEVRIEWLRFGKGPRDLNEGRSHLDESSRLKTTQSASEPFHVRDDRGPYAGGQAIRLFPLISWVQAGDWTDLAEQRPSAEADEWLPCATRCGPRTFVLRVQGRSMEPRFTEGELIFVDPDAEARNGSFVVVRLDDDQQATFKQLVVEGNRRFLRPLNERWPDPIIEINGHATVCGVVVFQGRPV